MKKSPQYIFVTGGVCSGLGKGISSASIGAILKSCGIKIFTQKLDPYINVDPGTMSPHQHGEVFVTDDGAETDLDLGHYERFIDENLSRLSSVSSGQIYSSVIQKERQGDYLGKTIQVVPHITNAIKEKIQQAAENSKAEILLVEIGGTVGDIEGEPFLEAARQLQRDLGKENVMFIHLVLLPYLMSSKELKSKPAQASVRMLRHAGINADMILARSDYEVSQEIIDKLALFCDVDNSAVIPVMTANSIYEVPIMLEKYNISQFISERLGRKFPRKANLTPWKNLVKSIHSPQGNIKIGIVAKYMALEDSYLSVIEALKSAAYNQNKSISINWVDAENLEKEKDIKKILSSYDGIVVPGGFGKRGIEGKISAAKYARENNIPYLGLCLGSQIMAIEFARNVLKMKEANSTEFNETTPYPVVHIMEDQKNILKKGGTMRLGSYPCHIKKGTQANKLYKSTNIIERHRHRFEFNNLYRKEFENKGLIVSGESPNKSLVEIVEIKNHPFMVGSQFHPEFLSRPLQPHPLFLGFIKACTK